MKRAGLILLPALLVPAFLSQESLPVRFNDVTTKIGVSFKHENAASPDKPLPEISTTLPGVHHFETLLAAADAEIDWPVIDETSAYSACYTTGTTGRPKGIFYSHRGIYLHTLTMVADLGMRSSDAVMLVTPMFHGQCWGLPQAAVRAAAKVVLPGRYMAHDTKVLVDAMIAEGVTVANGAPAIFVRFCEVLQLGKHVVRRMTFFECFPDLVEVIAYVIEIEHLFSSVSCVKEKATLNDTESTVKKGASVCLSKNHSPGAQPS